MKLLPIMVKIPNKPKQKFFFNTISQFVIFFEKAKEENAQRKILEEKRKNIDAKKKETADKRKKEIKAPLIIQPPAIELSAQGQVNFSEAPLEIPSVGRRQSCRPSFRGQIMNKDKGQVDELMNQFLLGNVARLREQPVN